MEYDVRWKQRFENFDRALTLLREPFQRNVDALSALEKEGTVQRFEYTLKLAWTTMTDLLQHEGRLLPSVTPRSVVKEAFAAANSPGPALLTARGNTAASRSASRPL